MGLIPVGKRDAWRLGVLQAALAVELSNREGAAAVSIRMRQFKRVCRRVSDVGTLGVVHGNRGRPSARRLEEAVRARVGDLLLGEVKLNDHHLADRLATEGVAVSPASGPRVRRELKSSAKRRRRASRQRVA